MENNFIPPCGNGKMTRDLFGAARAEAAEGQTEVGGQPNIGGQQWASIILNLLLFYPEYSLSILVLC